MSQLSGGTTAAPLGTTLNLYRDHFRVADLSQFAQDIPSFGIKAPGPEPCQSQVNQDSWSVYGTDTHPHTHTHTMLQPNTVHGET